MSGTILRRRDRTARPPRVEHYSSAVNTSLHTDKTGWQAGEECQHLPAPQLPAQHHSTFAISPMKLEHRLSQIKPNRRNIHRGRSLCLKFKTKLRSGAHDAVIGGVHTISLLRQSVYGRLASYEDVNDADRLGRDPAMRWIVGGKAVERGGASTSQMGRFETELLANNENLAALADLSGMWIDRVHDHDPPRRVVLDMDSSVSPTFGEQEGTAYNGHFGCTCYHPLFVFNQFGDLERCALRPGNVHSAHGWRDVLVPVVERYKERAIRLYFRGDAAFASPEIYDYLEAEGMLYAIRLPANKVLQESIAHLLKRPVGRLPKGVRRYHASFSYQAGTWDKPRRVVAKVEWHPGELYPRVGFIVTNLGRPAERVVAFYNQRGTAEQWIKEGKNAIRWTRLSCRRFDHNAVRLQLHELAYNLGNFMRTLALPDAVEQWSLTSLREKLIKIGAKIVRHGRYVTFQMAEVVIPRDLFADILRRIDRLRPPPAPA